MDNWKDIKGFEGHYQISDSGLVKSIGYYKYVHGIYVFVKRDLVMTPTDNGNGYLIVSLKKLGRRKSCYVHRLVAEHFVENKFDKKYVNHIDGNKKNNNASNLEWVTQRENVLHSVDSMKKPKKKYKASNTGEKYICFRGGRYRLCIRNLNVDRSFPTLESAVAYRNEVLNENGIAI